MCDRRAHKQNLMNRTKGTKPTHRAWWLQIAMSLARYVQDTLTAVPSAPQWLLCFHDTSRYLTAGIKGSDHLMERTMRERLAFERLHADEHSSSSCR